MSLKFYLGIFLEVFSIISIIWCIVILVVVCKLAFIQRKSPIYVFSAANILADIMTLFNYIVYLGPCIITDSYIFWGEKFHSWAIALGVEAASMWFIISFAHILVALNRLIVLCFDRGRIFSYRVVCLLTAVIFVVSIFGGFYVELIAPCCMFLHDHEKMSFTYQIKPGIQNDSNVYANTPVNVFTSAFCAICYTLIYLNIKKAANITAAGNSRSRKRELIYALQFCVISIFHLLIWVSLRLFPLLIDTKQPGASNWFTFTSTCQILSSLAVTFVYTFFNREVKSILKQEASTTGRSTIIHSIHTTSSSNIHRK